MTSQKPPSEPKPTRLAKAAAKAYERGRQDGIAAAWPGVVEVHDAHCRPRDTALEAVRQVVEADAAVLGGAEYFRGRGDVARAVLRTLDALTAVLPGCSDACRGTWPHEPGQLAWPFHVMRCPNNPALTTTDEETTGG